jgi:hypothetical protein
MALCPENKENFDFWVCYSQTSLFRFYDAENGFDCYNEDQVTGINYMQCYDYETRYYCERGIRILGGLFTGRYGDENESGNRLKGMVPIFQDSIILFRKFPT